MSDGSRNHKNFASAIAWLLILTSSITAYADQSATRALLEKTGVTTQIYLLNELIGESSRSHAARCNSRPPRESIPGFNAESVIFDLQSEFDKSHTQSIKSIEEWYQSALAKKIRKAESDTTPLSNFLQSDLYKNATRKNLITKIVDNLQIPEFVAIIGTEIEYAGIVHSGCIGSHTIEGEINKEQVMADITRNDKELIAALVRGEIISETAYLYRHLTVEELKQYEAFTSSSQGQLFYSNLINSVRNSLKFAGDRLTHSTKTELLGSIDF